MSVELFLYFDGASRGNPGKSGAGAWIFSKNGEINHEIHKYLGIKTNNQAEYLAIQLGLEWILELTGKRDDITAIHIIGDSQLVIRQLTGVYRVKSNNILNYYQVVISQIQRLHAKGVKFTYKHVLRAENTKADRLANKGIDEK